MSQIKSILISFLVHYQHIIRSNYCRSTILEKNITRKYYIGSQMRGSRTTEKYTEREYASPCIGENTFTSSDSSLNNFGVVIHYTWEI